LFCARAFSAPRFTQPLRVMKLFMIKAKPGSDKADETMQRLACARKDAPHETRSPAPVGEVCGLLKREADIMHEPTHHGSVTGSATELPTALQAAHAVREAQTLYSRMLSGWAMDVLRLRRHGRMRVAWSGPANAARTWRRAA
jgi:hypothetical protein